MVRQFSCFARHKSERPQWRKIVICGPSGSGKSTLIRCINGWKCIRRRDYRQRGAPRRLVKNLEEVRSEVGMLFQQFNLFPHMTVLENCALAPMWVRHMPREEAEALAHKFLARVRIPHQAAKYQASFPVGNNSAWRLRARCA